MKLRLPIAATVFSASLFLCPSVGEVSHAATPTPRRVANSTEATTPDQPTGNSVSYDIFRNFDNGPMTHDEIQERLANIAGNTEALNWFGGDQKTLDKANYRLSSITTHVINLETNSSNSDKSLEILFEHSFAQGKTPEDSQTQYVRLVNEAEERTVSMSIVAPRIYNAANNSFDFNSAALYQFHLKNQAIARAFDFRSPEGTYELSAPTTKALNPLAWLASADAKANRTEYDWTSENGQQYVISITPRVNEIDALTFEITAREINSLVTTTFILVYEAI